MYTLVVFNFPNAVSGGKLEPISRTPSLGVTIQSLYTHFVLVAASDLLQHPFSTPTSDP
jgi:hypothetical protein